MGKPISVTRRRAQRTAMRKVLKHAPGSVRALAAQAGVQHSTLVRVRAGSHPLSPAANKKIQRALRSWGATCYELADILEAIGGTP